MVLEYHIIIFILDFSEVCRKQKRKVILLCFRLNVLNKGKGTENK